MREKLTKPYCNFCKNKLRDKSIKGDILCKIDKHRDTTGVYRYSIAKIKNKDFQCTDFEPKLLYRKKYK